MRVRLLLLTACASAVLAAVAINFGGIAPAPMLAAVLLVSVGVIVLGNVIGGAARTVQLARLEHVVPVCSARPTLAAVFRAQPLAPRAP